MNEMNKEIRVYTREDFSKADWEEAVAAAMATQEFAEDDYQAEDGLMHCGKCHEAKQAPWPVGGLYPVRLTKNPCKCEREEIQQREMRFKKEQAEIEMDRLRKQGLSDNQFRESTFAKDDGAAPDVTDRCKQYVEHWEEMKKGVHGLMFYGPCGGGKTFMAGCIANALIEKGIAVMMTTMPNLITAMTANFGAQRAETMKSIKRIPLMIIDDFGIENSTANNLAIMYEIINTRYKSGLPMIVTTNLSMKAIREAEGMQYKRIYSRVVEMCHTPVKVDTDSRRQQNARKKMQDMQKILYS